EHALGRRIRQIGAPRAHDRDQLTRRDVEARRQRGRRGEAEAPRDLGVRGREEEAPAHTTWGRGYPGWEARYHECAGGAPAASPQLGRRSPRRGAPNQRRRPRRTLLALARNAPNRFEAPPCCCDSLGSPGPAPACCWRPAPPPSTTGSPTCRCSTPAPPR